MTLPLPAPTDLTRLRDLAATVLAAALNEALHSDDRLADAQRAIHRHLPQTPDHPPGHTELVRRECLYRLARAARLTPGSLLTPIPTPQLESLDRAWPRPVRRAALLTAAARLPASPDPALLTPPSANPPTTTTDQLTRAVRETARLGATDQRSPNARTLTHALRIAARASARGLPPGYDLLLEREMALRLALTLGLPADGALAPGLDTALAHTATTTPSHQLADLILAALRPAPTHPAPGTNTAQPTRSRPVAVPWARNPAPRCACACASGGFCGGCGHAGCGRRP